MVLVRKVHKNPNRHLFYFVNDSRVCVNIKLGETYYDFWCANKKWSRPDGDNKFSEKDDVMMAEGAIKAQTNSWLRMHWWLIKYYNKNIGRWKSIYKNHKKRIKLRKKLLREQVDE